MALAVPVAQFVLVKIEILITVVARGSMFIEFISWSGIAPSKSVGDALQAFVQLWAHPIASEFTPLGIGKGLNDTCHQDTPRGFVVSQ